MTVPESISTAMMLLQFINMIAYFTQGDWHRGIYWAGACILTLGVTL